MPYYVFNVQPFAQLEKLAEFAAFREASAHAQAMRLQCGGLAAIGQALGATSDDVHRMVGLAYATHGRLSALPWAAVVATLADWQPRRRRPAP